jgi:AcrR family transcriptional regulator
MGILAESPRFYAPALTTRRGPFILNNWLNLTFKLMDHMETAQDKAPQPRLFGEGDPQDTKIKLLEAAFRRLAREGYAALSMREIAKDAGVNHALINYHFRSKDQLVIAVLDEANRRLLERQQRMYAAAGGFAEKWAQARVFYKSDLASGFVRLQAELWAASLSDPGLKEKFLPRLVAWRDVVASAVRQALATLAEGGVKLPPPFTAEVIACWICEFWLGMEFVDLIGTRNEQREHRAALDAMQTLLEELDARVQKAAARGGKKGAKK